MGGVEPVEVFERLRIEIHAGNSRRYAGIREFSDLLGQKRAFLIMFAIVAAPTLYVAETIREARDIGRFRQVSRHRQKQRSVVVLGAERVDPGAPRSEERRVG